MTSYEILKSLHIISVIAWMAGMLYLPRLYVYHVGVPVGSDQDKLFQTMERRLLRYITNPAMIASYLFGILLMIQLEAHKQGWFHTKFLLVLLLSAAHGLLARHRKQFARGENKKSARYYKILNEVPTVLMIGIVLLVVAKPF